MSDSPWALLERDYLGIALARENTDTADSFRVSRLMAHAGISLPTPTRWARAS